MTPLIGDFLVYAHVMSLALWFGGLFGYVFIVWPAAFKTAAPTFPRTVLAEIASRTAPWIYLAMAGVLFSYVLWWILGFSLWGTREMIAYFLVICLLIGNNVYGSLKAWPTIMMAPEPNARNAWKSYYARMAISLVIGLASFSLTIIVA